MFRGKTILLLFSTLCSVAYLAYRALYTLNLDGYWTSAFSVAVLIAEIHGVGLMLLYYWQIRDTTPAPRVPPLQGRSVDIFLPTYNEDVPLLRGSLLSYLAFDYPCRIYVLDDGNRPEVRKLAEELGVEYIARGNNLHAKAGNINHALEMTSGEFVVIFDADHVARPHFISRTIGYFADDRVGWVQTPHAFYNFDSFSSIYQPERSRYWEEGDLFYRCIQP
jgi:cellulose synthase/poly-beta-1,6-N-acetylglucosamine synthase-like glycosyltransferase